jgi:putative ATP-dependent endonuclease of the OLD family
MAAIGDAPVIHRLTIERFRGIKNLVWCPGLGVNLILGGGDVGKTTILDAVALLLHPTNTVVLSDADYWARKVEDGFCIEAVMSLPASCGINQQTKNVWPWEWDGKEPKLPVVEEDHTAGLPVYRLRVRGTPDFEVMFEVLQPDGTTDHLSVGVRQRIGLVRLGGDDRNDRDLRLIQGSALDRLLADKTLRSRLGHKLAEQDVEAELAADAKTKLQELEKAFQESALPTGLGLGLTGGQGLSLNALIGLTASKDAVKLPLASWGAGTRRLAALEIAAAHQGENAITVVDEVERGLEPYRQRTLVAELQESGSQVFVTTHSAAALSAASATDLWYVDVNGTVGKLPASIAAHRKRDPETFLARLAIVGEGLTEVGFVTALLEKAIGKDLWQRGIWITDGGGIDPTLTLLEDLAGSGLRFGGFVDGGGPDPNRWAVVQKGLGKLLFRWPTGCIEENILKLVSQDRLEEFINDPEGVSGLRLRTLADRLGLIDKEFSTIKAKASDLKALIIQAATGAIPAGKENSDPGERKTLRKHAEAWFKSIEGGNELAAKVFDFELWPQLEAQLLPFVNAVRAAVSLPEIDEFPA